MRFPSRGESPTASFAKCESSRIMTLSCVTPQPLTDFLHGASFSHPRGKLQSGTSHYALPSSQYDYHNADSRMLRLLRTRLNETLSCHINRTPLDSFGNRFSYGLIYLYTRSAITRFIGNAVIRFFLFSLPYLCASRYALKK